MPIWTQILVPIVCSVLGSAGLFALIENIADKKRASNKMLLGLGHYRIMRLGKIYLDRGWLTLEEYENLTKYLYEPYREMGGNGTAEKIMKDVAKLPIKDGEDGIQ